MVVLCDSGILLRLHHPPDPRHFVVGRAVDALRRRGDRLVSAFQNRTEFCNACTRPATVRGGFGLTLTETLRRLRLVERGFPLLADLPAVYPLWRRLVVRHAVQGRQVHDARLVGLMQAHGITHILTLNGPDFSRYPGIVVLDPAVVAVPPPPPATPPAP